MDEIKMPKGHEEAMKDLLKSMKDEEVNYISWQEDIHAKKIEQINDILSRYRENNELDDAIQQIDEILREARPDIRYIAHPKIKKDPWKPLCHQTYNPTPELDQAAKKRGLKFTVGQSYPIYAEIDELNWMAGIRYVTKDDEGNRRSINSIHFNNEEVLLRWVDVVEEQTALDPRHYSEPNYSMLDQVCYENSFIQPPYKSGSSF